MDMISELPKHILHRILYFLSQNEAVRTSVLSKSWRTIWRTRPNLDLDFSDPTFRHSTREFLFVVDNTLQLYRDRTLRLEEFRLSICTDHYESVSLLQKWIPLLTSMGVKEFRLSISSKTSDPGRLDLPSVVFEAVESLKHLRVERFLFDEKAIEKITLCKNLRSLHLVDVAVDDSIFQQMIARCPLIENLCVEGLGIGLRTINTNDLRNLEEFTFTERLGLCCRHFPVELCSIEIYPVSLRTININYGNIMFRKEANFLNLNDLFLQGVKSSLDNLSFGKFPRLRRLTLLHCDGLKESRVFIDAPNILYFEYKGDFVPTVSFATNSFRDWKSEIHIQHINDGSPSWFLKLNKLLKSLSQSKISLSIYKHPNDEKDIIQENIDPVHDKPVLVESLNLACGLSSFPALVNGVFSICRSRNIGNYLKAWHDEFVESEYSWRGWEVEFVGYMWKILMERESGSKDEPSRLLLRDLEEASMEIMKSIHGDEKEDEWYRAPLSECLLNLSRSYCRFALKWRDTM
ncbi:PREDICTED: F-box/FBD/LRR-repeat protein At5g53840-like [Erythranthe guttata]|uniref:F-box/FBD/LRR-repeat protein At5g53840-like n=1 Tax=Erythranthe guttata TaxID=4155 RepID=UPI00064DE45B|nr:PREDICTED: F-box/FBD/LRR-repeat protein At5g53840-like [Erythranthe guttata]XP_012846260.1 PREDICTED: F-box/FBD/LRR-repeat protein At5g53840-like [Erythranthe guttata]|eukprot:XP_012846259.1 PREDICTED: F-box/FBD/LRR-repeat protein At5g53840-like [Erythranthe guttata]